MVNRILCVSLLYLCFHSEEIYPCMNTSLIPSFKKFSVSDFKEGGGKRSPFLPHPANKMIIKMMIYLFFFIM